MVDSDSCFAEAFKILFCDCVDFDHEFDLVCGPVANDRVYICLNMLEDGLADRATVIAKLKTYVLADQILFHTAKSLLFLEYASTEEVPCK